MMIAYSTGITGGTWVRSSAGRSQPEMSTGKLSEGKWSRLKAMGPEEISRVRVGRGGKRPSNALTRT